MALTLICKIFYKNQIINSFSDINAKSNTQFTTAELNQLHDQILVSQAAS